MPPTSKKNYSIVLYDVHTKSKEESEQALLKIYTNKYFANSNDLVQLILINSQLPGIKECGKLAQFDPTLIYDDIQVSGAELFDTGNWIDALILALEKIKEDCFDIKGIVTLQILFITDLSVSTEFNENKLNSIIDDMNRLDVFLYIIGPDVEVSKTITCEEDIRTEMKNAIFDGDSKNLIAVKKIIDETRNTVVCNFKMGIHLFFTYKNHAGRQPWNTPLSIGSSIEISTSTLKHLEQGVHICLKKTEGTSSTMVWVDLQDESVKIDSRDVIKGVSRHGVFVRADDNRMFKGTEEKCFTILQFTKQENIPEYYMRGSTYNVIASAKSPSLAFNALLHCLAQRNLYAVVKRIYAKGCAPTFMALVPKLSKKKFLAVELPCEDDILFEYTESEPIKTEKDSIVTNFLNNITINDDQCKLKVLLTPNMMNDLNADKIINKGADKLFGKELNLQNLDIGPLDVFDEQGDGFMNEIKEQWLFRDNVKKAALKQDDVNVFADYLEDSDEEHDFAMF